MRHEFKNWVLVTLLVGGAIACSKVTFSSPPSTTCTGQNCITPTDNGGYNLTFTTGVQRLDLLFVIDNSASMYPIQQGIAARFSTLFNIVTGTDYRIALTTTDVTSSANPPRSSIVGNPIVQDGDLIRLSDGSSFLSPGSAGVAGQFATAISRRETERCQNYIQTYCPSGCTDIATLRSYCPSEETRAIWASILTVQKNPAGFIRDATIPLNIVIVSNSDERASGGTVAGYPLESNDQPSTLRSVVQSQFPGKTLKVHSLIIQPGDVGCYNSQYGFGGNPYIFGFYGNVYNQLSSSTGGTNGSICSADYSSQLTTIARESLSDDGSRTLPCKPKPGALQVTLPGNVSSTYSVIDTGAGGSRLVFSPALPPSTTFAVKITSCQ